MRILVVGAGAVGGYFGGRLLEAGRDVTFLVRPERAARLAGTGLVIKSDAGDAILKSPPTILASEVRQPFDVILLSCKSYDLDTAISAFTPAVGQDTSVVPLLNGMRHLDVLDKRLGASHILGGLCLISARLDADGRIVHLNDVHQLSFGERNDGQAARTAAIADAVQGALFDGRTSKDIVLEMWEKWVFLATLAGINCLMRSAIGDIVAAGGADLSIALLEECRSIAAANGRAPRPAFIERASARLVDAGSTLTASMLSDLEGGGRTEADHILGDLLLRRGNNPSPDHSLLRLAHTCARAQAARRAREKQP